MTISTKQHNAIALLIFLALLVFFRLNSAAFHEAESIIVFKADLLVQFNGWLDLAPYSAPNGSFTLPPMSIWLTALVMKYIGNLPLHLRLVSALFSAASLVLIYQIARRIVGYQLALIAPALLAATVMWNEMARQVNPEIPAVMYLLLGLWSVIMLHEREDIPGKIGFAALYALGIAGACLSNFVAGGMTLLIALPFVFHPRRSVVWLIGGIVFGLAAPISWYSHVFFTFSALASPYSVGTFIQSMGSLLMSQPFVILAVSTPFLIFRLSRSTSNSPRSRVPETAVMVLLLTGIICSGFSSFSTLLLLTPAAILLALRAFELLSSPQSARIAWVLLLGLILATVASMNVVAYGFIRNVVTGVENLIDTLLLAVVLAVLLGLGFILPKVRLYMLTSRLLRWSGVVIPVLLILRILVTNISKAPNAIQQEAEHLPTNHIETVG